MNGETTRRELSFDGCGINGPDEYRTRVATFKDFDKAGEYGPLFEAAPELLAALEAMLSARFDPMGLEAARADTLACAAIAAAKGEN